MWTDAVLLDVVLNTPFVIIVLYLETPGSSSVLEQHLRIPPRLCLTIIVFVKNLHFRPFL